MTTEEIYRVIVEVHEVQGLIWPEPSKGVKGKLPNPFVEVAVADESQYSVTREATSTCTFNRCFLFSKVALQDTLDVRVYHKGFLGQKELIGAYSTLVESVRDAPDHRIVQGTYPLVTPEKPSEPRGFVRLSLNVLKIGELLKKEDYLDPVEVSVGCGTVPQNSRLLKSPTLKFESYNLTLNFHFGQDILKNAKTLDRLIPSTHIRAIFIHTELSTTISQTTHEPTWSEGLRFPATYPCSNDKILIELWSNHNKVQRMSYTVLSFYKLYKSQRTTSWINFYTEIPSNKQRNRQESRSALAVFASLFELESEEASNGGLMEYNYLGRVLMSTSCEKCETLCLPTVLRCSPIHPPPDQKFVVWIDLFELSGIPDVATVMVQLSLGDWEVSRGPLVPIMDCIRFSEEEGRIPEEKFYLPASLNMSFDFIIRVYGQLKNTEYLSLRNSKGYILLGYAQISPVTLIKKKDTPYWIDLIYTTTRDTTKSSHRAALAKSSLSPLALLASVVLRTSDEVMLTKQRPNRLEFPIRHYLCEAICYQAVNLPILRSHLPSPHATISLGGGGASTEALFHTIHPDWYEMLCFKCTLHESLSLVRDLWIQVISRDILLGEASIPVSFLMTEEGHQPQWYPLLSKHFPRCQGRILCSFHLKPLEPNMVTPQIFRTPSLLNVDYEPYDVKIFVVGCRIFQNVCEALEDPSFSPEIQLEFGRQPENPNMRLWYGVCDKIVRGSNGNFDYFLPTVIQCFLPKSELFQTFLELRIFQPFENESRELGTAYLHLTPRIPCFSPKLRQRLEAEFRYNLDIMEDFHPPQFYTEMSSKNPFIAPCTDQSKIYSSLAHHSDLEIFRLALADETTTLTTQDTTTSVSHQNCFEDHSSVYTSEMNVFYGRHPSLLRKYIEKPEYLELMEKVSWANPAEEITQKYEELNRTLESELHLDELPYVILPILAPGRYTTTSGTPDVVGILKVRCKILREKEDPREEDHAIEILQNQFIHIPSLMARVHILSASGLFSEVTSGLNDTGDWFLTIENGSSQENEPGKLHQIKDTSFTGKGYAPDFYRSFELHVEFPKNTFLSVGIASAETLWSSSFVVGRTLIDLENRYFYSQYQPLLNEHGPILVETRILRDSKTNSPTAHIRLWVDLLTEQETLKIPLVPITLVPPEIIQVRAVIWRIKGISIDHAGSVSLYVIGMMPGLTSDCMTVQETDTHWNSLDGTGIFNWRFVFDVMVPSEATQLRFQVWSRNILTAHEALAETVFELSADLMKCKTLKQPVKLERAWVKLSHSANRSHTIGYLELEVFIVPQEYALDHPVGLGRQEPNEDPFLADVIENRNYISSSVIGTTVFGTSEKILYGARMCSWLVTVGVIITLYAVFCKIFFS